jgi:hypothetical protein
VSLDCGDGGVAGSWQDLADEVREGLRHVGVGRRSHALERRLIEHEFGPVKVDSKAQRRVAYLFFHVADYKRLHRFMEAPLLEENTREIRNVVAVDDRTEADPWAEVTAAACSRGDVYEILIRGEQGGLWHFAKAG